MTGREEVNANIYELIEDKLVNEPEYVRGFINSMTDNTPRTKLNYLQYVRYFLKYINYDISKINLDVCNAYMTTTKYNNKYEERTASYQILAYASLKKFCQYMYNSHRIDENYMQYVKRPKAIERQSTIEKRERGYLTEQEIGIVMQNIEDSYYMDYHEYILCTRNKAIMYILLTTGIRCSALCALDVDSLDLDKKTLIVSDKGEITRTIYLSTKTVKALSDWLDYREEYVNDANNKALFVTKRRKRVRQHNVSDIVKSLTKNIYNKEISPHKLRATYGTQLYNQTKDIYFVQKNMGHSSPAVTQIYIRDDKEFTKRASDIMSDLIR